MAAPDAAVPEEACSARDNRPACRRAGDLLAPLPTFAAAAALCHQRQPSPVGQHKGLLQLLFARLPQRRLAHARLVCEVDHALGTSRAGEATQGLQAWGAAKQAGHMAACV